SAAAALRRASRPLSAPSPGDGGSGAVVLKIPTGLMTIKNSQAGTQVSVSGRAAPRERWRELETIVGAEHLHAAGAEDAIDGQGPSAIVEPANWEELAQAVRFADENGLIISARGNGTKLDWGNPARRLD